MEKTIYQEMIDRRYNEVRLLNFFKNISDKNLMLLENPTANTDWSKFNKELELFLIQNRYKFERK